MLLARFGPSRQGMVVSVSPEMSCFLLLMGQEIFEKKKLAGTRKGRYVRGGIYGPETVRQICSAYHQQRADDFSDSRSSEQTFRSQRKIFLDPQLTTLLAIIYSALDMQLLASKHRNLPSGYIRCRNTLHSSRKKTPLEDIEQKQDRFSSFTDFQAFRRFSFGMYTTSSFQKTLPASHTPPMIRITKRNR